MAINIPNKTALFNPLSGHLEQLFVYIYLGDLGLPDLQRPFLWNNSKLDTSLIQFIEDTQSVLTFYG